MNFKELQKEIEKNAKQDKFTQLFAESDDDIKDLITYILSTREDQEIVKNIRIFINQPASPYIETIYNGLLFQLDDANIKIIIDDRCEDIENMLKEFSKLHIDSKNIKINDTESNINFGIIVDDNDYIVQVSPYSDKLKIQAVLNCHNKHKQLHEWIKILDEIFDELKPLENKIEILTKENKQLKNKITLD